MKVSFYLNSLISNTKWFSVSLETGICKKAEFSLHFPFLHWTTVEQVLDFPFPSCRTGITYDWSFSSGDFSCVTEMSDLC